MAARDTERYYWLKLDRGFFKRHDITVIEDMPNGKDYVLFYLKLMLESVDHEGALRFSDTIPYSETMLARVTKTNVDIVRSALKIFVVLHRSRDGGGFRRQDAVHDRGRQASRQRNLFCKTEA